MRCAWWDDLFDCLGRALSGPGFPGLGQKAWDALDACEH